MAKTFTKVTKTYSTKNKLQRLILEELSLADCTLFPNPKQAISFINQSYESALKSYKGNAAVPPLKSHDASKEEVLFYVEDVIYISMYNVKSDFSCQH